jgi:prepilin-type N-terminal cleavage/methylation domain-containing protein
MKKEQNGFSLLELSVAIVIIGFIAAAVLQGKNILENAKIRSIVSEFTEHQTSANSFKLKYLQYPGDFDEAEDYWGNANTINGDGDGKIEFIHLGVIYESYRAWQHLSYAKMTKANYAGNETSGAAELDIDVPSSKQVGGYILEYGILGLNTSNVIALGIPLISNGADISLGAALSTGKAYAIDNKTDGGNPSTGKIRGIEGNGITAGECVNTGGADDIYNIQNEGLNCIIGMSFSETP